MKGKIEYGKIVERRMYLDITQKQMAEETGVDVSLIKYLETGRSDGTLINLEAICKFLDLEINDIYNPNYRETLVISVINSKGGVSKSSTVGTLAYALSEMNKKVLCIDADMSMNLTDSFGIEHQEQHFGLAIENEDDISNYIRQTQYKNIDFVVSSEGMSSIDMVLFTKLERESIVKYIIKNVVDKGIYDYILFDTNPVLSMLNYNILVASRFVIIPIVLEKFSINLNTVLKYIESAKKINGNIEIAGILITKYDKRQKIITDTCEKLLNESYPDLIFKTIIGIDTKISMAQMNNKPVIATDKSSRISMQYREFAKELIKRVKRY